MALEGQLQPGLDSAPAAALTPDAPSGLAAASSPGVLSVEGESDGAAAGLGKALGKGVSAFGGGIHRLAAPPMPATPALPQEHIEAFHSIFGDTNTKTAMPAPVAPPPMVAPPAPMAPPPPVPVAGPPPMTAMSDARAKTGIRSGVADLRKFLDVLGRVR